MYINKNVMKKRISLDQKITYIVKHGTLTIRVDQSGEYENDCNFVPFLPDTLGFLEISNRCNHVSDFINLIYTTIITTL